HTAPLVFLLLFSTCSAAHRDLPSFPTRRSSDLQAELFNEIHRWVKQAWNRIESEGADRRAAERRYAVVRDFLKAASQVLAEAWGDRKSTRLNSSHVSISYAVFCLKKKKQNMINT